MNMQNDQLEEGKKENRRSDETSSYSGMSHSGMSQSGMSQSGISQSGISQPSKRNNGVSAGQAGEDSVTKQIESVTTKVPSTTFLTLAVGSMIASALLQVVGRKNESNFVGQWAPTILIMGLYNKLVKLEGSE